MTLAPQHRSALELTLPATAASVAEARRALVAWLRDVAHADGEVVDDLAVVVSELTANATRTAEVHGDTVTVEATVRDGALVLSVDNPADMWVPPTHRWDMDDPLRGGGRGLQIVRAFVDELRVEQDLTNERTIVTAVKSLTAP